MQSRNEPWTFNSDPLETINSFTYLNVLVSVKLSFNKMAYEQAVKAKRVLISLFNSLYDLGQMPKYIFFKLFDKKVSPVFL